MKVQIITVGDEILIGQVVDTNSAWMGRLLNLHGAAVVGISSVGDELADIQRVLGEALAGSVDVVLMTGGLGPTKDDITKKAIADFFNVGMVFDQPTYDRIIRLFERWGRAPTEAHRDQCFMPANAELLYNKMGSAPGMWFEHSDKVLVAMPGVPYEMEYLMEHQVIPRLRNRFPGQPIAHRSILTVGEGESRLADRIADIEAGLPPHIKLAFLPDLGRVRLRLTGVGNDETFLNLQLDEKAKEICDRIPELIFGLGEDQLEAAVGRLLKERGVTLCTAESCTGGYLAHCITSVPGSSDYFLGSVVAYSNEVKMKLLKVQLETLEKYGAVSEQTVAEMARGALDLLGADISIAVSGIAGPGGGTPEKPVGTIWMAVADKNIVQTQKIQAGKDRLKNIQYASVYALNMIRLFTLARISRPDQQKGVAGRLY